MAERDGGAEGGRLEPAWLVHGNPFNEGEGSLSATEGQEADVPAPRRTPSGYRRYPADVLNVLAYVVQARQIGLTLGEIRRVVALHCAGSSKTSFPTFPSATSPSTSRTPVTICNAPAWG